MANVEGAKLPDNLNTTLCKQIARNLGIDISALPDNLETTLLKAIAEKAGGSGGGGADGRGLKTLEAATIEELYNKLVALDKPVLFKVETEGYIQLEVPLGGQTVLRKAGSTVLDCILEHADGMTILTIVHIYPTGYFELQYVQEYGGMGTDNFSNGEYYPANFSDVTKFTAYYF